MSSFRTASYRLGLWVRQYRVLRWAVAGLERAIRWSVIAAMVVFFAWLALILLSGLNYAPLWIRVYDRCVDAQPEAASITEAIRNRSACGSWATRVVEEQMKADDQAPRGPKGK